MAGNNVKLNGADTAPFVLKAGESTVTRDEIVQAMAEFDRRGLRERGTVGDNKKGWSVEQNGRSYNPKWLLKLATDTSLTKFHNKEATETLRALGFEVHFDRDWQAKMSDSDTPSNRDDEIEEPNDAAELTFDIERNLQKVLRSNIEQLEHGLRIIDGGKEQRIEYGSKGEFGQIDITAEDPARVTVVIELKAEEAGRRAIGQVLGYMGVLTNAKRPVRGILVAREFSPQAIAAARVVPNLRLVRYSFKFTFETAAMV